MSGQRTRKHWLGCAAVVWACGSLVLGSGRSAAETIMVYTLDPRSEFVVQLFKAGIGAKFAHDHVVRAAGFAGQIRTDPADPTTTVITVEVQTAALQVDEPPVRQKYGLTTVLSKRDRQETQAAMAGKDQLDVRQYPSIRFQSTAVEPQAPGQYRVTGDLTIRGISQSFTFPVQAELRDGLLHARGSFPFKQSSFGYQPYSALFGAIKNQDEVVLHFDLIARPSQE
jgi:polyisoprenoid-binding protein YceI